MSSVFSEESTAASGQQTELRRLALNESHTSIMEARNPWNSSGLLLSPGQSYRFEVTEEWDYRDSRISTTANGYEMPKLNPYKFLRRFRQAPWYRLIGSVGQRKENFFAIGIQRNSYTPAIEGELFYFSNDVPILYRNNHGSLEVKVTRIR